MPVRWTCVGGGGSTSRLQFLTLWLGFKAPCRDYVSAVFSVILTLLVLSSYYCASVLLLFSYNFVVFISRRRYASAGTGCGPVSVCVCLCHKSEFYYMYNG